MPPGLRPAVLLAALALVVVPAAAASTSARVPPPPARIVVDGKPTLRVWLATTPQTRQLGVHRWPLRPGTGLWFGWPGPTTSAFWMQGVSYPLLLVWLDGNGRVIGMRRMAPCAATSQNCALYSPPRAFRYAIELRPADLKRSGLRTGAIVRLKRGR